MLLLSTAVSANGLIEAVLRDRLGVDIHGGAKVFDGILEVLTGEIGVAKARLRRCGSCVKFDGLAERYEGLIGPIITQEAVAQQPARRRRTRIELDRPAQLDFRIGPPIR